MSNLTDWGLPENYKDPSTIGDYLKLGNKEHFDVRVLGDWNQPRTAVQGWVGWKDVINENGQEVRAGSRVGLKDKALLYRQGYRDNQIKFFWALVVYNRDLDTIQCWEITQVKVRSQLTNLLENKKWGILNRYDITVSREGEGYDTEYTLTALPDPEGGLRTCPIAEQALEESTIDLRQLFVGGDIKAPVEEQASDGDSEQLERDDLRPVELVRNRIEAAQTFKELDDALMLKKSYVERGDIPKAEQMALKSIEVKAKERLSDEVA
tara:strand:+ start:1537 stop:2334 length:798 start_codon:yes stop_codon:yes gene_type:complete